MVSSHGTRGSTPRRLAAVAFAAIMALSSGGTALAFGPEDDPDAGIVPAPPIALPSWKLDLVALHGKQLQGTLTTADAKKYNAILAQQGADYGLSISASPTGGVTPMAASYSSHALTKTQKAQTQGNWCGPATAQSIVLSWHYEKAYSTVSKYDGQSLSQLAMSGSAYTGATGTLKGTGWDDYSMLHALNRWLWGPNVVKYLQTEPDSVAQLKDYITTDLDINWMVAMNTIEPAYNSGLHYNNHPVDKTLYHWISVYGYSSYGDTLLFQDPVGGSTAIDWPGTQATTFSMTDDKSYKLVTLSGNGVGDRGFDW